MWLRAGVVTRPDCGCGDHSEHRRARRGSSQSISSCGGGSQVDNHHKETWVQLAARASELRAALQELACVVTAKEADSCTPNSITSDR
eukprot:6184912-Pleurochrysis_carterae.AAC.1